MSLNLCGSVRFSSVFFNHIVASERFFRNMNLPVLLWYLNGTVKIIAFFERNLAVCWKRRLSGRRTATNDITHTPSGTLNNTALTLIQVLNLHRVLAVSNLIYLWLIFVNWFLRRQRLPPKS